MKNTIKKSINLGIAILSLYGISGKSMGDNQSEVGWTIKNNTKDKISGGFSIVVRDSSIARVFIPGDDIKGMSEWKLISVDKSQESPMKTVPIAYPVSIMKFSWRAYPVTYKNKTYSAYIDDFTPRFGTFGAWHGDEYIQMRINDDASGTKLTTMELVYAVSGEVMYTANFTGNIVRSGD